ncbi:MAG: O-antigen ligase family protein [Saccharofermentans sp.]|nr:O-antigen ligase family protein [Saccharofermentans sp.]
MKARPGISLNSFVSEEVFYKAVMTLVISMPVVEFFTEILSRYTDIFPCFFQPLILSLFGVLGTMLVVIYRFTAKAQKRVFRYADLFYFTLLFFMIISAVFSQNPGLYSSGDFNRCENPLHFLAYFWLFFSGSLIDRWEYRKNILLSFLAVSLLEGVFAFLQTFNIELSYSYLYRADRAAYGLTQNSNYYGCLAAIFVACVSGLYIFADSVISSKVLRSILPAIAAFLFYTMLGSRARLAWVGFASLMVFYVISLIIMCRRSDDKTVIRSAVRRSLILLGVFAVIFLIAFFFTDYIREVTVRSYWEVANGKPEMVGSRRVYIWKTGLGAVPEYWLTGVGLDNFKYVFEYKGIFHEEMFIKDKAHNEYIQFLVTQGIPAFVNYLALLIYTAVGAVRNILKEASAEKRAVTWILLGMFVTYATAAFFNNSIVYVALYFWLVIGLIIPRDPVRTKKAGAR